MATRIEFEIDDHGVDHSQYFQGAGVSFSRFTHIATGAGTSARAAAEDAAEQMYNDPTIGHADTCPCSKPHRADTVCTCHMAAFSAALDAEIAALSDDPDAHGDCEDREDTSHEECELYHYVSIRWRISEDESAGTCSRCGRAFRTDDYVKIATDGALVCGACENKDG